jgi:hypothetical protein
MSTSRRGAQGESVKSKKNCTQKYAKWNPVPKNMQSCTPEKCLPETCSLEFLTATYRNRLHE